MPNRLLRARLNDRIARAAAFPVTLIAAPAGFGKSIALADFLQTQRAEVVRYDVPRERDTLAAFVRGLAAALAQVAPSAASSFPSLETRMLSAPDPARECAEWFAEHLRRSVCTIVVDDFHHAAVDPDAVSFLVEAVARTKGRISWIVATRTGADLPVASWIAYGIADAPVGEDDLRFTPDEALAAAEQIGADADPQDIEMLREMTGGWAVGLTIAFRTKTHAADLRAAAAGTRELAYRYLAEQVFAELPDDLRRLLLDTSPFAAFDDEIVEALGASPELVAALRRVPFLTHAGASYRYHDLFRDFLEMELRREGARAWRAACGRAAEMLERRGETGDALRLFARVADDDGILRTIERAGFDLVEKGDAATVSLALEALSGERRETNAMATGVGAMLAAARGHAEVAERMYRSALALAGETPAARELAYRFGLELVRRGADCEPLLAPIAASPDVPPALLAPILATLATGLAASGRREAAAAAMERALDVLGSVADDDVRARVFQQAAYAFQFEPDRARAKSYAELAIDLAVRRGLFDVAARAYSVLYTIVYEQTDDPIAVLGVLDRLGECARKAASVQVRLFGVICAYEVEAERGDEAALAALDEQLAGAPPTLQRSRLESLLPAQAMRLAWSGRFAEAWASLKDSIALMTTPERRAVRAADVALYAIAGGLADDGEVAAVAAREALSLCTAPSRRTVRARAILALAETLRGHSGAANADLNEAERTVGTELPRMRALVRCARAFLALAIGQGEHAALAAALERLRSVHAGGTARLIAALPEPIPSDGAYPSLTAAERRILDLLVEGASTKEIAARTDRSPQTIDTHVRSICRKLECSGRREAVALAVRSGWSRTAR